MKESQLDNKTAIATNDYVRMVDENGNSVKIKKDSFMAAIRDAFPSIISDGETGAGSVLSIINGALKTRTDANLASVLGALKPLGAITGIDLDTVYGPFFGSVSSSTNLPGTESNGVVIAIDVEPSSHDRAIQIFMRDDAIYFRIRWQDWTQPGNPVIWKPWHKIWPQT